ncbi:MAG TPA: GDP-L-fucose synthase [Burkholderiales bacterium]|nr:GDP-L-fucose synthase [Burkholderiales bacterium]
MNSPINHDSRIYVAGHRGMAGSALVRRLERGGYRNLITCGREQLDLLNQAAVRRFMMMQRPDYIFLAAAKVGGIHANNTYRADFIYQNLMIAANVIQAAHQAGVQDLLFLGSSCIYPRDCPQPMKEEHLLTAPLESTNAPYAIAKIAGIELCQAFNEQHGTRYIAAMPTNLYGPNDNYDLDNSHVLPALLRKAHEAVMGGKKRLQVWGSGRPRREFLHVDDMADACVFLMENGVSEGIFNVGSGTDVTIRELAELIADIVGFKAELTFDPEKPDGTPRKLLDVSKLKALGWTAKIGLREGIEMVYEDYRLRYAA